MDYQGFLDAVRNLNENSYFYGNEVLYRMAAESDLTDKDQLAGMMWLIGRSYAASPQRRSYGVDEHKVAKWPVRSDNDGRDQFFASIANRMISLKLLDKDRAFEYNYSPADIQLLSDSIDFVLQFNLKLSEAIEIFDYADKAKEYSTNHISFCSKFLHFYYPHSVFIIDSFAQAGANRLFGGKNLNYICTPNVDVTYEPLKMQTENEYHFKNAIYVEFDKEKVNNLLNEILDVEGYVERKPENAKAYITHCVRSYILGCQLRGKVAPSNQLKSETKVLCSMPRLVDTVFLNIKGKLTDDEKKRYRKLYENYGERCDIYKAYGDYLQE